MLVISLGGSILVPDAPDTGLIAAYRDLLTDYCAQDGRRCIIIVGGGGPARRYQGAYRELCAAHGAGPDSASQDWIGIMATRLNAELFRHALGTLCSDPVVTDPSAELSFTGQVLVGAGWKPGFSTDFDAVMLAERYGADTVVNLSNIAQVYTADPKLDPNARPLERVSWQEFLAIVGEDWTPGSNLPFDPVATRRASERGLRVIAANGRDLENTRAILTGAPFTGTTIGPD